MRTTKPTTVLIAIAVLALGAGVVAGTLASRLPSSPLTPVPASGDRSVLAEDLKLTPEQRDQMRRTWEAVRESSRAYERDAVAAQHDCDDAIYATLNKDQQQQYNRLKKECQGKINALTAKRNEAVKDAIRRTSEMLTPSQREIYERMIKDRVPQLSTPGSSSSGSELPPLG